jgi:ParB family transcriptional regulator, chromosome partitioning protein
MDTRPISAHWTPEVDLHRLELRFAQSRLIDPRAVDALARSIEQSGQLIACIAVVLPQSEQLVLIDGYRRVLALQRLGRDRARVQAWTCDLTEGLLTVLAQAGRRPFAALEEALLLRELVHGQGLSEREVARRCGRDVSWVSRRLALLCGVPDDVLQAVREGVLSTWAASRVLAPLARANSAHASALIAALTTTALSTRELGMWFQHYQQSSRVARERMVSAPRLFIQSLAAQRDQESAKRLSLGPEDQCAADIRRLLGLIRSLCRQLSQLRSQGFTEPLTSALLDPLRAALESLQAELANEVQHDSQPNR